MIKIQPVYVKHRCRFCSRAAYVSLNTEHHGSLPLCHSHFELFRRAGGMWSGNRMMRGKGKRAAAGAPA